MTGRCCRSWPCPTAPTRESDSCIPRHHADIPRATEDFSYFTLRHEKTADSPATSLFGIACTRQLGADELINRPADVTRSTVQKAVVVISDSPQHFGHLREKLSVVTKAWFAQRFVEQPVS